MLAEVVEHHWEQLQHVDYCEVFQNMRIRHEQNQVGPVWVGRWRVCGCEGGVGCRLCFELARRLLRINPAPCVIVGGGWTRSKPSESRVAIVRVLSGLRVWGLAWGARALLFPCWMGALLCSHSAAALQPRPTPAPTHTCASANAIRTCLP